MLLVDLGGLPTVSPVVLRRRMFRTAVQVKLLVDSRMRYEPSCKYS